MLLQHEDAKQGGLNAVKKHVGRGADINAKDDNGVSRGSRAGEQGWRSREQGAGGRGQGAGVIAPPQCMHWGGGGGGGGLPLQR